MSPKMENAATRVFGIPELLEEILIEQSIERLFIIQRVNRTFRATINDSSLLQGRMGLRHLTAAEYKMCDPFEGELSQFVREKLDIQPGYCGFMDAPINQWWEVEKRLNTAMPKHARDDAGTLTGLRGKQRIHPLGGSWAAIKLTLIPMGLRLRFSVYLGRKRRRRSSQSCGMSPKATDETYEEIVNLGPGSYTLGDYFRVLCEIDGRSVMQHYYLAHCNRWAPRNTGDGSRGKFEPASAEDILVHPRLIELILAHLSLPEMIRLQRLNKRIKSAVRESDEFWERRSYKMH